MGADIFDLVNSKAIGEYVTTLQGADDGLLGAALFPSKKIVGLDLKFVKGYKQNAVALKPSTLGSRAEVRDRIGGAIIENELPFFREKMVIDERLRQQLVRAKLDATDPYTSSIIEQIFDDTKRLVDGADVQAERERMNLLFEGKISITGSDKQGRQPKYDYDYDGDGSWAKKNRKVLTGTAKWNDHAASNPLSDIITMVDKANSMGVKITRGIVSPKTWQDIMQNANVKNMFKNADGSQAIFGKAQAIQAISQVTGVTIAVYGKSFNDENGKEKFYAKDDAIVLFPDGALGATVYGTTPEEVDLMSGTSNSLIATTIVNTGVAITTVKSYGPPVTVDTVVSELVLPSFERMAEVFVVTY
jgi:hypothetical protein